MRNRIDFEIVASMVKKSRISEKLGKKLLALPLIYIDMKPDSENGREFREYLETVSTVSGFVPFVPTEIGFCFTECVVYLDGGNRFAYVYLNIRDDFNYTTAVYTKDPVGDLWVEFDVFYLPDTKKLGADLTGINERRGQILNDLFEAGHIKLPGIKQMGEICVNTLRGFQNFCNMNNERDRYLVEVKPVCKPLNKTGAKGKLLRVVGPRIVYLNALPKAKAEGQGDGTRTVAPHDRKGYHYTLRHERYRNHPYFQIPNKMYRKPTWVGDRSAIVNGAMYTVIEKVTESEKKETTNPET